jgi:hypothetical protein
VSAKEDFLIKECDRLKSIIKELEYQLANAMVCRVVDRNNSYLMIRYVKRNKYGIEIGVEQW